MTGSCDITIVGAGPYGLSIAAHLRDRGLDFRIIGRPMHTWTANVPEGMLLKSAGFASNLYAPGRSFELGAYCRQRGIAYEDVDFPIPVDIFRAYGIAFQKRFAPDVMEAELVSLERCGEGFELRLEGGNSFRTSKVILAIGLDHFRSVPKELRRLPPGSWTHSADHHELQRFRGNEVAVIGGGSSATDLAVLLHEAGASVTLVARKPSLEFGEPWRASSPWRRIRHPVTGIGPGWKSLFYAKLPMLYRYLPDDRRIGIAKGFLGPSGGWFMKARAAAVPALLGHSLVAAQAGNGKVSLQLAGPDRARHDLQVDHVISATGYDADLRRLPFLSHEIREQVRLIGRAPLLSPCFECSVPGLYFVGPVAAASFGPVMRFAVGADFTSRRIARHLAPHRYLPGTRSGRVEKLAEPG